MSCLVEAYLDLHQVGQLRMECTALVCEASPLWELMRGEKGQLGKSEPSILAQRVPSVFLDNSADCLWTHQFHCSCRGHSTLPIPWIFPSQQGRHAASCNTVCYEKPDLMAWLLFGVAVHRRTLIPELILSSIPLGSLVTAKQSLRWLHAKTGTSCLWGKCWINLHSKAASVEKFSCLSESSKFTLIRQPLSA